MTKEIVICLVLAGALILLNFGIVTDLHRTIDEQAETIQLLEAEIINPYCGGFKIGDIVHTNEAYHSYYNRSVYGEVVYIEKDLLTIHDQNGHDNCLNVFWIEDTDDFITVDKSDWRLDRCEVNRSAWNQIVVDIEEDDE